MQAIHVEIPTPPMSGVHRVYGTKPKLERRGQPAARALAALNIGAQLPVTPDHRTPCGLCFYVSADEADRIRHLRVMPFIYCFSMADVSLVIPVSPEGHYSVRAFVGANREWAARDGAVALAAARDQMVSFRPPSEAYLQRSWWRSGHVSY